MEPPPPFRISATAALVPRKTPLALTSITLSHSSAVVSSRVPQETTPALLTRTWRPPNRSTVAATALRQSSSLVTSRWT